MFRQLQRLKRYIMSEPVSPGATTPEINIDDYHIILEGKARILAPKEDKVFYNPIQQFNRDLSITAINAFVEMRNEEAVAKFNEKEDARLSKLAEQGESNPKRRKIDVQSSKIRVLEALSATGLRAIRYGHEITAASEVVANDLLPEAVKSIDRSVAYNQLQGKVKSNLGDAIKYMATNDKAFHVIDLDPYGTASPFIDSAIQAVQDGGLLLITCTDAGVLAGSGYPEKCFALYGGNNFGNGFVNNETNHEAGLRLILSMVANTAAKYKKSIEPLLSLSIDFYMRVFIRVTTLPMEVKKLSSKTMISFGCNGCGYKVNQPLGQNRNNKHQYPKSQPEISSSCKFCGNTFSVAGPMWGAPIHNERFINKILELNSKSDDTVYQTHNRIKGMLTLAKNELAEQPFYFNLNQLSSLLKAPPISIDEFAKALGNLDYDVSLTHAKKNCIKTDAPWETILKVNQQWLIKNNKEYIDMMNAEEDKKDKVKRKLAQLEANLSYNPNLKPNSTGARILDNFKDLEMLDVDFTTENDVSIKISKLRKVKLVRFQENPTKNWGPKARPSLK